jgi:hypothetical protein
MSELGEFAMFLAVGFTSLGLLFGPIGTAIGRRLTGRLTDLEQRLGAGRVGGTELEELQARLEALESGQHRLAEVEERLDFAERLLATQREPDRLEK